MTSSKSKYIFKFTKTDKMILQVAVPTAVHENSDDFIALGSSEDPSKAGMVSGLSQCHFLLKPAHIDSFNSLVLGQGGLG